MTEPALVLIIAGTRVFLETPNQYRIDIGHAIQDLLDQMGTVSARVEDGAVHVWNGAERYVWTEAEGWRVDK